ncbi:major facilitator superfamily domain-containing protein [Pyronema omphalodes]|nr:major facilitator superfamily domain-containing protein [Pyronema omphalodes]
MEHSLTVDRDVDTDTEKQLYGQQFNHSRATTINSKFNNADSHDVDEAITPGINPPSIFKNVWHEILFIIVVTSAQLITQANLGNTVFPQFSIASGLGILDQPIKQSWFVASYSCTVGTFVLITGRLGDLYGRRNLFLLGYFLLTLLNIGIGFARNHIVYDILRALSGIGPSIMMPNAAALLGGAWQGDDKRSRRMKMLAFCTFGAIAPGGYILGGAWGAGVIEAGSHWGWVYWSMAIVCAGLTVAAWLVVPDNEVTNGRGSGGFDWWGSLTGVCGLVMVFIALNGAPDFGWKGPISPTLLILGVLSIIAFCYIETKVAHPLLPMEIFRSSTFSAVAISLVGGWSSFGVFQYYQPHFLIQLRGISPLHTSLQMLPCALTGIIAALLAVFLLSKVPGYTIFGFAMFCFFLGQLLLIFTPVDQSYWQMTFPICFIICFGPDLSFACASLIASDKLKPEQQGVAGSFINTIVNYSIALGLAVVGNVEAATAHGNIERGYRSAFYTGTGLAALGIIFTAIFWRGMSGAHKGGE